MRCKTWKNVPQRAAFLRFLTLLACVSGSPGQSKRGLSPKSANWAKKGLFRGKFCSSLAAVRCGGIGPNRPQKAPETPWKGPISPEKPDVQEGFCPIFSKNLGLKPPFVSSRLDFPNCWVESTKQNYSLDGRNRAMVIAESLAGVIVAIRIASVRWRSYFPPPQKLVLTDLAFIVLRFESHNWRSFI